MIGERTWSYWKEGFDELSGPERGIAFDHVHAPKNREVISFSAMLIRSKGIATVSGFRLSVPFCAVLYRGQDVV
jgi:hypothetical protein